MFKVDSLSNQLINHTISWSYFFKNSNLFCMCCQKPLWRRQMFFDLLEKLIILFERPLWVFNIINMV